MQPTLLVLALLAAAFVAPVRAHTETQAELEAANEFFQYASESISNCANAEHIEALEQAAFERRTKWLNTLRAEKNLHRRDLNTVLNTDHKSKLTGITPTTPASTLFKDSVTCILQPEVTEGPYWVSNEVIRTDIREKQPGVDLYLDLQFIDIKTCQPATGFYVDLWNANSTGVYSHVVSSLNGNGKDTANLLLNSLRGIQPIGSDGVVQFLTKYPASYPGRTNHVHLITSKTGTYYPSTNTYLISGATHVGQIFFDQSLNTQVRALPPYSTVTGTITTNQNDPFLKTAVGTNFDPVVNYVLLGSTVKDGVFGWIRVGIDTTKTYTPKANNRHTVTTSFNVQDN